MKKIILMVLLLSLTACVKHWADYQPQLNSVPADQAKYESDRKLCIADATERGKSQDMESPDAKLYPRAMVDQCMATKGYDVLKVEHSFSDIFKN